MFISNIDNILDIDSFFQSIIYYWVYIRLIMQYA